MGISIHPIESFDETEAINILKALLESKHTIKTFFGENDRTPNHDGFFELIDHTLTPRKQFIVQIKKTKKLTPNVIGTNKGKYVYELKTNFLEYVKQKVTESPAIYFVVDIEDKRIFWLYLSDEVLMNMDFEGKEKISYGFSDENILSDIISFTSTLDKIILQRNKIFVNKTSEDIAKMQDAIDYLNQYLDHDLKAIKDSIFPNLWRFGIKCSDNPGISIGLGQEMNMIDCSDAVALYPQIKGTNDSGIQEYMLNNDNLFNHLTLGKQVDLSEYSKDTLNKIIVLFFEKGIPAKYLPNTVLSELIHVFIKKSSCFFDSSDTSNITVNEANRRYILLCKYAQYLLSSPSINDQEKFVQQTILNRLNRGQTAFWDIMSYRELIPTFSQYCKTLKDDNPLFSPRLFLYISKEYYIYLDVLMELKNRNIDTIQQVWDYEWFSICQMSKDERFNAIENMTKQLVSQLTLLYNEMYDNMFPCNKYKTNYKYLFKVKQIATGSIYSDISYVYQKYKNHDLSINYDSNLKEDSFMGEDRDKDLVSVTQGVDISSMFIDDTPLYYSLSCMTYNGICETIGLPIQKLKIGKRSISGGLSFF